MSEVDVNPTCPKCGEETYPTMILLTNGHCQHCGAPLEIRKAKGSIAEFGASCPFPALALHMCPVCNQELCNGPKPHGYGVCGLHGSKQE